MKLLLSLVLCLSMLMLPAQGTAAQGLVPISPVPLGLPIYSLEDFTTYDRLAGAQWADWNITDHQLTLEKMNGWRIDGLNTVLLPTGNSYFGWEDARGNQRSLFLQMLDREGNRLWSQDTRINDDVEADFRHSLVLLPDMQSGVYAVFADSRDLAGVQDRSHIFAQRISPDGQRLWADDLWIGSSTAAGQSAEYFQAAVTETGELAVFWKEGGLTEDDQAFYIQKYTPGGLPVWAEPVEILAPGEAAGVFPRALAAGPQGSLLPLWMTESFVAPANLVGRWIEPDGSFRTQEPVTFVSSYWITFVTAQALSDGSVYIAWFGRTEETGERSVFAQRYNSNHAPVWSEPLLVNAAADIDPISRLKSLLDTEENLLVWWDQFASDVQSGLQKISPAGQRLLPDDRTLGGDSLPYPQRIIADRQTAVNPQGEVVVGYRLGLGFDTAYLTTQPFDHLDIARSVLPKPVNDADGTAWQVRPSAVSGTDGSTVLLWQTFHLESSYLFLQRYDSAGQPLQDQAAILNAGDVYELGISADLAVDGQNNAVAAWEYWEGENRSIRVQKIAPNGQPLWPQDQTAATDQQPFPAGIGAENRLGVGADAAGNVYVAWSTPDHLIMLQKFNPQGQAQWPGGKQAVTTPNNPDWLLRSRALPAVDVQPDGTFIAAWHQFEQEPTGDESFNNHHFIYAQRFTPDGTALWDADVQVNHDNSSAEEIRSLVLDVDPGGGAYMLTNVQEPDNDAAYVMRVTAAGQRAWDSDFRLTTDERPTYDASLAAAPDGSAFLAWAAGDVQAQKISSAGDLLWAEDVVVNDLSLPVLSRVAVAADPSGNASVAFQFHSEFGNDDTYFNRINATGTRILNTTPVVNPDDFYHPTGEVQSKNVAPIEAIQAAKINGEYELNGGTVQFFLSVDGGKVWHPVTPGVAYALPWITNDVRWRVVLQAAPGWQMTPVVHSVIVTMYPSSQPYRSFLPVVGK